MSEMTLVTHRAVLSCKKMCTELCFKELIQLRISGRSLYLGINNSVLPVSKFLLILYRRLLLIVLLLNNTNTSLRQGTTPVDSSGSIILQRILILKKIIIGII